LAQLLAAYDGRRREMLGAFIPEVKGDLVDAAIYLARQAGRDVARDVVILSPASRIPVVRYRDEEGRPWFLSARGGCRGSEAADYFPARRNGSGPEALEDPERCGEALPEWRSDEIPLAGRQPRFVGWRWERGGLRRAGRRSSGKLLAPPPRALWVEAVEYIDNGVHYNLIDPRLPPAEVAERLTRIAALARGGGAHRGENDYFYEQGRKLLGACLTLLRAVGAEQPTLIDVMRCATQNDVLEPLLEGLGDRHRDLAAYFRGEWLRMVAEGKTATVVRSTLSAAFDPFLHDPALAETFCRPSTFSFADAAQHGRIIGFVPGDRYEQLGRSLGTACKMDFQSAMLSRTSRSDLNASRLVAYVADECHKYAAAGSATAGDPYFMNLSRSNQVANLCATQSYAWLVEVLGRDAANVYISAFGVQFWLQQTDPETCRRAAEICGTLSRERVATEHDLNLGGMIDALHTARPLAIRRRRHEEDAARFRPEDFALLDVGETIGYNKGLPGRTAKARRGRVTYLPCTHPPGGPRAVNAAVRDYYREVLENRAAEAGHDRQWDGDDPFA
ncbi:MAG TPA: TraM recognition domain-containing protein, partial [Opitutaceae bacterium]|nr:TraM recognition domain-containing protein [Opitutaceae bacterium]